MIVKMKQLTLLCLATDRDAALEALRELGVVHVADVQPPDFETRMAAGDLSPLFNWLSSHIWQQASRWETPELVQRATGEALNPGHLRRHLEQRYLGA